MSWGHNLNPFKPNRISHFYQLDQSISILRAVGWYFQFYSNFIRTFCKQIVETQIRCPILWHLVWVCTVCLCPAKKDVKLKWVNRLKFKVNPAMFEMKVYLQCMPTKGIYSNYRNFLITPCIYQTDMRVDGRVPND